jgi:hypothetical protein
MHFINAIASPRFSTVPRCFSGERASGIWPWPWRSQWFRELDFAKSDSRLSRVDLRMSLRRVLVFSGPYQGPLNNQGVARKGGQHCQQPGTRRAPFGRGDSGRHLDFEPQFVAPGTKRRSSLRSRSASTGRNVFRGPFQVRFDMSLAKQFALTERSNLRFQADSFNVFNHPDFDAPNNNVDFFPNYAGPPANPPQGSLGIIQHTIGSPRFCNWACT